MQWAVSAGEGEEAVAKAPRIDVRRYHFNVHANQFWVAYHGVNLRERNMEKTVFPEATNVGVHAVLGWSLHGCTAVKEHPELHSSLFTEHGLWSEECISVCAEGSGGGGSWEEDGGLGMLRRFGRVRMGGGGPGLVLATCHSSGLLLDPFAGLCSLAHAILSITGDRLQWYLCFGKSKLVFLQAKHVLEVKMVSVVRLPL